VAPITPPARRRLGELEISAIGLGAPIYAEPSADAVVPNLHRALDRGIDLVDSSDIYWRGRHEEFVGQAIKGLRHRVVLATKF
jgi:aryl-alcohol dehydrogenase-like predicted oxidoreductase